MSCVEPGGQKAAPKIFAGADQISPPAKVSKQKEMTKTLWPFHKNCAASRCSPAPALPQKSTATGSRALNYQAQWWQ